MSAALRGDVGPAPSRRPKWLWTTLAATLAATVWAATQDEHGDVVAPASSRLAAPGPRSDADERSGDRAADRRVPARAAAASAAETWPEPPGPRRSSAAVDGAAWTASVTTAAAPVASAPARAASVPAAPSLPQAPTFAYTLIGRLDDGQPQALLAGTLRSIAVRAGDIVDGEWRVDAVRADGITLTWIPGGQLQQLRFKAS